MFTNNTSILLLLLLLLLLLIIHIANCQKTCIDVVIVGAGVAGLTTAEQIMNVKSDVSIVILEARNRSGGRIYTANREFGGAVDMGASWIEGTEGNPIHKIFKDLKLTTTVTDYADQKTWDADNGNVINYDDIMNNGWKLYQELIDLGNKRRDKLQKDIDLQSNLIDTDSTDYYNRYVQFHVASTLEFDYGAPDSLLSTWQYDSDQSFNGADLLVNGGYIQLIDYLSQNVNIVLDSVVTEIISNASVYYNSKDTDIKDIPCDVTVKLENGDEYNARRVVVSVPLGVLKSNMISFTPPLSQAKQTAISRVGVGLANKVAFIFTHEQAASFPNWNFFSNLPSQANQPTQRGYLNYFANMNALLGQPVLVAYATGDGAEWVENATDEEILNITMPKFWNMFGNNFPYPQSIIVTRWKSEPFSQMSYSYAEIGMPWNDTSPNSVDWYNLQSSELFDSVLFAGEHTYADYRGSVSGAYLSGIQASQRIVKIPSSTDTSHHFKTASIIVVAVIGSFSIVGICFSVWYKIYRRRGDENITQMNQFHLMETDQ